MRQLVHEVGHLWTPRSSDWPNRFAEQGLATYLQVAVARELSGEAAAEAECESLRRAFRRCPQAENVSLLERHVREGLHGVTFCVKGALALVALESLLGRDRFWELLRDFAAAGEPSAQDLVDMLRERHPGRRTEEYLACWFSPED